MPFPAIRFPTIRFPAIRFPAIRSAALGVVALLTLSAGHLEAQSSTADSAAVMAVVQRLFDGMRQGDSAMVRSVFDPRVRMMTSMVRQGKPVLSIDMGADNFAKAIGTPHADVYDERIKNPRVQIDGALASVWVDYAFFRGTTFSHCGVDHFLLTRNESGTWTILELSDTRRNSGCEMWTR